MCVHRDSHVIPPPSVNIEKKIIKGGISDMFQNLGHMKFEFLKFGGEKIGWVKTMVTFSFRK